MDFTVTQLILALSVDPRLPLIPTFRPVTAVHLGSRPVFLPWSFPPCPRGLLEVLHLFSPRSSFGLPVSQRFLHGCILENPALLERRVAPLLPRLFAPLNRFLADWSSRGERWAVFKGALFGCHGAQHFTPALAPSTCLK